MKHIGDITKINGAEIEPVWCICGGSPCQDLSVAGKRAGLEGARSGLFMEQIRVIKEMRENDKANGRTGKLVRPRYTVWENVVGAFSSAFRDGFGDFGAVLEETVRVAEPTFSLPRLEGKQKWTKAGAIVGDGWSVAWRTHDAQYWGVPQRRRRICLVADYGGYTAGGIVFERIGATEQDSGDETVAGVGEERRQEVLALGKGLSRHLEQSGAERKETAGDSAESIVVDDRDAIGVDGYNHTTTGTVTPTIGVNCGMSTGRNSVLVEDENTTYSVDMGGGKSSCGVHNELAPTLATTNGGEPVVAHPNEPKAYGICSYDSNSMKSSNPHSGIYEADTSRTLDLNGGNPACNQSGMAVVAVDTYNNAVNDNTFMSITGAATDPHHIPCVAYEDAPPPRHTDLIGHHSIKERTHSSTLASSSNNNQPSRQRDRERCVATMNNPYQQTIGSLCFTDYKGIGNQYVSQDKCVVCCMDNEKEKNDI